MRRLFFLVGALACALPALAQTKRPFTFEDMMKLKRVEEPEVSPDGKWVLFAAVDVDLAANTKTPHVWVVPTAGGQEKEIIADQDAERPRWAPDGKRFAFISTKEGGSQVWIAEFDGAAGMVTGKHKLTSIVTEASGELWSPDGKNILFTSDVYPECDGAPEAEWSCNQDRYLKDQNSAVKAMIFDKLLYRHWNAYKRGRRTHIFVVRAELPVSARMGEDKDKVERIPIPRDLTPGDFDAPPFSLGGQDNYAFSPDGQEICYASNHDPMEAASTNSDLWIVPVNGGPAKNITADNPAADATPLYSPDGKYIAYRAQQRPGYESDRWKLMLYERKTGRRTQFGPSARTDFWVGTFIWATDSSKIYFVAEKKGESPLYSVSFKIIDGVDEPGYDIKIHSTELNYHEMLLPGYNDDLAVSPDGATLFFTRMSVQAPIAVYRIRSAWELTCEETMGLASVPPVMQALACEEGKKNRKLEGVEQLTHLNDAILSQVSMSPLEPFWFKGAHGDQVEGFLVKPPNFDPAKKYPVKFIIHGGPEVPMGDEWSYRWNAELFAANGYVVIMIAFHGTPGYGQEFIDSINGDWGGAPFEDLMKGLDYAEQHYPFIDKDRECALGASFGGYMVNWILGHTNRFKCLVSHDGEFNTESEWGSTEELWFPEWEFKGTPYTNRELYRKWSPDLYAANFKTPTLVIHGQKDYRLDVSQGFELFTTLQRLGVPSKMLYFPDEGHWVLKPQNSQLWYKTVNDWVDQWVGK